MLLATEPQARPDKQWGTEKSSLHVQCHDSNMSLATELCVSLRMCWQQGFPEQIVQTEPHVRLRICRRWGINKNPSPNAHSKSQIANVLAPPGVVISQALSNEHESCPKRRTSAWVPCLYPTNHEDSLTNASTFVEEHVYAPTQAMPNPSMSFKSVYVRSNLPRRLSRRRVGVHGDSQLNYSQACLADLPDDPCSPRNVVPRRLSRQCVCARGDSMLNNMQAGGNTCPAEPLDDPSSQCERLRCLDWSRNGVSVQSMSNNMQAGGNNCSAGPLDDVASLRNLP